MKKNLLIAAAVFTFSAAFSQEGTGENTKTFSIGPSIGFGHTGIRNTMDTDLYKPWWTAGVILNYSTKKHVGFAADILYSSEGSLVERRSDGQQTNLTLQYIRVPLKFAYFFGDFEDNLRPKVTIGPSLGFLLKADSDIEGVGSSDVKAFYESFDIGLNASAGFNLKVTNNIWLNADLNYYTGFMAIRSNQYNSNFGLKVGLAFGI